MIRLRTTRGGVRDIFTSRKANGRLLSAEVPQGGDAISDDGVLRFPLATVASETRRRDTLWLFLDASAGTSWLGATLAVFLDPATRSIARQSLDARPSEAEHAERELAALATSFDVLPIDHTATSSSPSRGRLTRWTSLIATVVAASIFAGAGGGIALYRLSSPQPKPGPSTVSLDANSRNAIEDLTSRLSSPLGVTKLTDHEIEQLANAVISALPGSGSVSLDTKSMKAIEGLTSELSSALGVTKLTDHEMEQLTRAVISALVGTEAVRARIERVVNEYKITTTDQDDASQTLVNGIIAALRGI